MTAFSRLCAVLRGGWLLPGLLALTVGAETPPQGKLPEYDCPWVETKRPDVNTVWLWKFSSAEDRTADLAAALDKGDLEALAPGEAGGGALGASRAVGPRLVGGARLVPEGGRFGGGLAVDGTGQASGAAALGDLLGEGGLTLDFWFRADAAAGAAQPAILATLGDARGTPCLTIQRAAPDRVALLTDGQVRLTVPLTGGATDWHHLACWLTAPRGVPERATVTLRVDADEASAQPQPWQKALVRRLGTSVTVGGATDQPGLRGVVDEVRLSKDARHLYPWRLATQELPRAPADLELRTPYFRPHTMLTHYSFDGTLAPAPFAGQSWRGTATAAAFQRGVQGQALDLSHIDRTGFAMSGYYILPDKEGTLEFWLRPLDWNNYYIGDYAGTDVKYYWLMTLTAKDAQHATPTKDIEVFRGRAGRDAELRSQDLHPGTWTHVLISVSNGGPTVYLNGQRQKFWQAGYVIRGHPLSQEPLKRWRERTGGKDVDDTWTLAFQPSPTLVDEFTVFDTPMTPEEAWNAYARWLPDAKTQMKPLPVFHANFDYYAHSWDMQEKLQIRLACLPVGGTKPASADAELRTADGQMLLTVTKLALDDTGKSTFTLPHALPFGHYQATFRARDAAGAVLAEESQEYVREQPAWLGNTLGKDRTVPKPWTPITVNARTLGLIGRELELGPNGLPAKLTTLQQPVLAGPVTVRAGTTDLTGQGPTFTETAPDRVAWKTSLVGAGLIADLEASLEFDGLLYCAITLKPAAGAETTLADLHLDFPLAPTAATQLLANGGGKDFRASWIAKYVPQGKGRVWDSLEKPYPAFGRAFEVTNFMPHLWLGNDTVGLYFGAENDQGWTVDGPQPAQEVWRDDQAVVCRLNIIREPTTIPAAGRRFHFVLLPTPAKPEPPDWRQQMLGGVNFGSCDSFGGFNLKTDPADANAGDTFLLEPRSWEHAAQQAPQCRAKWGRCILYADASWPGLGPAFRDWNHDMWADTGRLAWTPEFEDYAVWAINEYLKRGVIDGVYWDDVSVGSTLLLRAGAYEYAGSPKGRRVGFTTLAQRRVNLRLWRLFEAAGKEPCIWAHMTVSYEVPLFSFCRYLSNCEFSTGVNFPGKRDAMDMWSADTLRLLGGSAKWGTGYQNLSTLPRTLPISAAARQWSYPQQRTETGLYLTSDQWGPADGLAQVLVKEKVFDGPVRAYPWWQSAEVLTVDAPTGATVRAAVYARDNRAVVVVANWDREERAVRLTTERLFPGAGAVSWRDLDPCLTPPPAAVASAADLADIAVGPATVDLRPGAEPASDLAPADVLAGTNPDNRAQDRLVLRTEQNAAHVVIRPRDYRVLEVRPR